MDANVVRPTDRLSPTVPVREFHLEHDGIARRSSTRAREDPARRRWPAERLNKREGRGRARRVFSSGPPPLPRRVITLRTRLLYITIIIIIIIRVRECVYSCRRRSARVCDQWSFVRSVGGTLSRL